MGSGASISTDSTLGKQLYEHSQRNISRPEINWIDSLPYNLALDDFSSKDVLKKRLNEVKAAEDDTTILLVIFDRVAEKLNQPRKESIVSPLKPTPLGELYHGFRQNPNLSPSQITKCYCYDGFSFPCSEKSFLPNKRMRYLAKIVEEIEPTSKAVQRIVEFLHHLPSSNTWNIASGTETLYLNGITKTLLEKIDGIIKEKEKNVLTSIVKNKMDINSSLSKSLEGKPSESKPEHRIEYNSIPIVVTEAKGVTASDYQAVSQCMQVGGDSALHMSMIRELSSEDCVIPGLLVFGQNIRVAAVYLISDYPCVTFLSPSLSFISFQDKTEIARWMIAIATFALQTISIINSSFNNNDIGRVERREQKNVGIIAEQMKGLKINDRSDYQNASFPLNELFLKPIRVPTTADDPLSHQSPQRSSGKEPSSTTMDPSKAVSTAFHQVSRMMEIYRLLYDESLDLYENSSLLMNDNPASLFLYPIGLMHMPAEGTDNFQKTFYSEIRKEIHNIPNFALFEQMKGGYPIMIFPKLSDSWKSGRPPSEYSHQYLTLVEKAVDFLNEREIAHEDLRPENIFFQIIEGQISLKIIDFEDSLTFGSRLSKGDLYRQDTYHRYPIFNEDDYYAQASHNNWFKEAIRLWLEGTEYSTHFSYFMQNNYEKVINQVFGIDK